MSPNISIYLSTFGGHLLPTNIAMRWRALTISLAAIVAIVVLTYHKPYHKSLAVRAWQAVEYKMRRQGSYQAWLSDNCNLPESEIIPDEYAVLLHPGYSVEEHKDALRGVVDLDGAIYHIFPEDDSLGFGTSYFVKLDRNSLDAVLGDTGVDMAECNMVVHLID